MIYGHREFPAASYDAWKTRSPWDDLPTCYRCGGHLRTYIQGECDACDDEIAAEEAMLDFYQWEPV